MAKAVIKNAVDTETPTQAVAASARATLVVIDARGRSITVRRLSPLARMNMIRIIPAADGEKAQYVGYCALACGVAEIDGERYPNPTSIRQIEAIVQTLDDDGLEAVGRGMQELLGLNADQERGVLEEAKN